ncbi:MAG: hypothetical protein ABIH65_01905 [Nanoarchaeota archaeon]
MKKNKEKIKICIGIILSIFLIFLGASIIKDILNFIFKDTINKTLFAIIHLILIYTLILIFWKTRPGKYLNEQLFPKKRGKIIKKK